MVIVKLFNAFIKYFKNITFLSIWKKNCFVKTKSDFWVLLFWLKKLKLKTKTLKGKKIISNQNLFKIFIIPKVLLILIKNLFKILIK